MSEEKVDVKKLTRSQILDAFLDGKVSKDDLKEVLDKDDLFKLSFRELENILYHQRKDSKMFPKKLRISSSDILYQYGRNLSGGHLMTLAKKDYINETDLLKALKKSELVTFLEAGNEVAKESQEKNSPKKEEKKQEESSEEQEEDVVEDVSTLEAPEELTKNTVSEYFSSNKLIKMFFAKKMTKEFSEIYSETFKDDTMEQEEKSKKIIEDLKDIFKDNVDALYIVIMRLHLKGIITGKDVIRVIDIEFFKEKAFKDTGTYEVLDKDGKVLYRYKKEDNEALEEQVVEPDEEIPVVENYLILEPLTQDEIVEAYKDSVIDSEVFKRFFTTSELIHMYKTKKVPVKVFSLIDVDKRENEIIKAYNEGFLHLEDIMELYFYYEAINTKELKYLIKNSPRKAILVRYLSAEISPLKVFELYESGLISFNILNTLKEQNFITEEEFENIRKLVDKESFYKGMKNKVFYTYQNQEETTPEVLPADVELSDQERILLTKVVGVSDEEIESVSIIDSKDEEGNPTSLDGYKIICDENDELIIVGKFDYTSPIYVMTYEEAAHIFRKREGDNEFLIYDDLMHRERFEGNSQVIVVEHDENMGTKILEALSILSENARQRYSNDEKYLEEIESYIESIDEKFKELAENN